MLNFSYNSVDERGRSVAGQMTARDEGVLEERLKAMGLWLVEAKVANRGAKKRSFQLSFGGSITRRDLIDFFTLMNFQLRSGVAMIQALEIAASDCPNVRFKEAISELKRCVETGEALADAMCRNPKVFPPSITSLIRSAESSGRVPEAFQELTKYLEWQEQIMADVRQATLYPAIVLCVVAIFVLILFTFVVPKFIKLLTMAKVGLPLITQVVFSLSDIAKATWWIWILVFLGTPFLFQLAKTHSPRFAAWFDRARMKVPVFGELIHMLVISRFAHNLAVLYRSGISLINSLNLCRDLVGSIMVSEALVDTVQRVEAGEPLSEALRRHAVFPPLLIRMVAMGERSGTLDGALENVSTYYDGIIPRRIKKVFGLMEPFLIITLVGIVGTVAMAIFLPIINLLGAAQ